MSVPMKTVFLEQFARIGKALSSPSRLALLDLLCQSEKSVETLVAQSGLALKNASAQLQVLKDAGLIRSRRDGKYIYYSVSDEKVPEFWAALQDFSSRQLMELREMAATLVGSPEKLVTSNRKELLARARRQEVVVIDVRPDDEYAAAHLPCAISIPLAELKSRINQLPREKEIVAYCRGPFCLFAVEAVHALKKQGFNAVHLDDGIQEWKNAGLPLEHGRVPGKRKKA